MKYNKILILGGICTGKTTLAKKISKILNIKTYEIDNIAYKRRDVHIKRLPKERDKKLKKILQRKKWILEGFYSRSWVYPIYRKADLIILLNIKLSTAKKRIMIRYLKRKFLTKKNKKINKQLKTIVKLLKYMGKDPKKYLKKEKRILKKFNKKPLILNNKKEIKDFVKSLK